jgi:threonine dehydrogenase-like Zn-dependent dehydrogenase
MQPLSDALGRVHDAGIGTGDVVAVVGAGVMGNQCGQLAQHLGASETYAIDVDPEKVHIAEELGMTGIDSTEVDPVETIGAETDGIGPDVVFAAVGGDQSHLTDGTDPAAQAMQMVRTGGTYVQVGILFSDEMAFDPGTLMRSSVDIVYPESYGGIRDCGPNRDAGEYAAELVVTDRVSIEQFVDIELDGLESFDRMVEITSDKEEYDTLGPAQISL